MEGVALSGMLNPMRIVKPSQRRGSSTFKHSEEDTDPEGGGPGISLGTGGEFGRKCRGGKLKEGLDTPPQKKKGVN